MGYWALLMFVVAVLALLLGFPVAFTLGAVAIAFGSAFLGLEFFTLLPLRVWGIVTNFTLLAVPLFIFMGIMLDRAGIAQRLLDSLRLAFGGLPGGAAAAVIVVGAMLAASTGVVGATVCTLGVIALPTLLRQGVSTELACGTVASSGTLGQLIPPSIVLILLGDIMGVPVGRLFAGALLPGLLLVAAMTAYVLLGSKGQAAPAPTEPQTGGPRLLLDALAPLALMFAVLGSIFFGVASPTESAALGGAGAILIAAINHKLSPTVLLETGRETVHLTTMVFTILVGATAFGLVFRGMGGDAIVHDVLVAMPGGVIGFLAITMLVIFLLGFFLDFLEICFVVVPIVAPVAKLLGIDMLWFAVLIAVNLQTSFLTPPFGFSLFYLKAVAPPSVRTAQIYRGVIPFVVLQLLVLALLVTWPELVLLLPDRLDQLQGR